MRSFTEEAIVLEVSDLQEADRVVVFVTREHGKRRGAARGAKRKYSRFAGQLQPLAKVKIGWFEKEGRELVRISAVDLLRAPKRLSADLEGILLGAYLGESVATFAQEGEPADKLYRLLDSVLTALEGVPEREGARRRIARGRGASEVAEPTAERDPTGAERPVSSEAHARSVALRYFESWLLRLAGVFPPPDDCPVCGRALGAPGVGAALAASGEALLCRSCAGENRGSLPVSPAALEFWRRIGREPVAALAGDAERPVSSGTLAEVEEVAGRIRRHFLQGEIRSYQVARRTLASLPVERAEERGRSPHTAQHEVEER